MPRSRRIKLALPKPEVSQKVEKYSNGRIRKPRPLDERLAALTEGSDPLDPHSDTIYQEADRLLRRTMAHLELLQTSVENTLAEGMGTPKLIKEAATVARTIGGISAELRQRQKFHKEVVENLTEDEVNELLVALFMDMNKSQREQLILVLQELNGEGPMLLGHA